MATKEFVIFEAQIETAVLVGQVTKAHCRRGDCPYYRLVSPYAGGVNITFFHNQETNTVRVPKGQTTTDLDALATLCTIFEWKYNRALQSGWKE